MSFFSTTKSYKNKLDCDERKKRSSFRETGPLYLVIIFSNTSYSSTGSINSLSLG